MPITNIEFGKDQKKSKLRRATALGYEPGDDAAPRVLATGKGKVAERILEAAKENNIPIHEDPVLAAALATLEVDDVIPPELYMVVAEVLAYIYRIRQKKLATNTPP
jgi:flagellar biosynthesis protein